MMELKEVGGAVHVMVPHPIVAGKVMFLPLL